MSRLAGLAVPLLRIAGRNGSGGRASGTAAADSEHLLNLFGRVILGAAKHKTLGDTLASEFVDLDHFSESDQTDEGVGRQ